jgi:cell division protein FtsL
VKIAEEALGMTHIDPAAIKVVRPAGEAR